MNKLVAGDSHPPQQEAMMQLTLQIVITDESGSSRTEELMTIQKSGETRNDIGLSVSESKLLLNTVQQSVVQLQADEYTQHHIRCPHCLAARRIKGKQKIRYRTLFGVIPVSGLRVYRCRCEEVIQRQSVCSATGPAIILTRH